MRTVFVIAPHPDDETLGCGATLLRHKAERDRVHWMIVTSMQGPDYSQARKTRRVRTLERVRRAYRFDGVHPLGFPAAGLDRTTQAELVRRMKEVFDRVRPEIVYLPFRHDAHSDHKAVFEAASSCCKWFRAPSVKAVLSYETPSETDAALRARSRDGFQPNHYVDISRYIGRKLRILAMYKDELGRFPFPRSVEAVRARAQLRGSECGSRAAEAFVLLKEKR